MPSSLIDELWQETPSGHIQRLFNFKDFKQAFAFMTECAMKAEEMNHHPEWFNVYNKVDVKLRTHDQDAITDKDQLLASFMDDVYKRYQTGK
mgnify:CR=1 FL=1